MNGYSHWLKSVLTLAAVAVFFTSILSACNNPALPAISQNYPSGSSTPVVAAPPVSQPEPAPAASPGQPQPEFTAPIADALARVTKKPFGIKVSPDNSPVSPERFSGYHTGVDFETTPDEADADIPVFAVCDGPLIYRGTVNGYGGVAVQRCKLNNEDITVLYGHLKLKSIAAAVNSDISAGDQLSILGQGYSAETDGERKHLHLGIHRGQEVNYLGYVPTEAQLKDWIDIIPYLK